MDWKKVMALSLQKVGVIGAGQMGNGIAHVCALAGFDVLLYDVAPDRIKAGIATINGNMARQVGKKLISEDDRKKALARIQSTESIDGLANCDIVIETATEQEQVKRQIFSEVCAVRTAIPSCAVSVQPAWSFGIPSISTRHMRHAPIAGPSRGS